MDTEQKQTSVVGVPHILILGDPKAGKTRLASLWPDVFFIDAEKGAGSAVNVDHLKQFEIGLGMLDEIKKFTNQIIASPYKDKRYTFQYNNKEVPVGGIAIDSLDAIQQVYKYGLLERQWKEPRQMWGKLLDDIMPLVYTSRKSKVPVIWIAHSKVDEPLMKYEECIKFGTRGVAAQGALEDHFVRWVDYILHIVITEDYKRKCFVQPNIWQNYRILAGDRHDTFKKLGREGFTIMLDPETGFPKTQALQAIYDHHVY